MCSMIDLHIIHMCIYVEMHMPLASALPFIVKMYDHLWLYGHKGP